MGKYTCEVCGYIFDEEQESQKWEDLADDWQCPVCGIDKSFFAKSEEKVKDDTKASKEVSNDLEDYLSKWSKQVEPAESNFSDIHQIAKTGKSITEPMKTTKPVISWDEILIKGAQLAKIPLQDTEPVLTQTIIGSNAKEPLILNTPIYISHMSFGALSKEFKTALAKGSARAKTAMCSGEGGILPDEINNAYKYIFEYVPNKYSINSPLFKNADAVEIKIGQSAKPGMGGHLPGEKVNKEIAEVRGREEGKDIHSPPAFDDINNRNELKAKIDWLREKTNGKPIGIKIAAGNIEADLEFAVFAKPDFITIDGRAGATGSALKFIKDSTSIPTIYALMRARTFLDEYAIKDISLIITGGLRISSDFAKALALGADAVAIATSAMIAGGCQQYRVCNTGKCPVGIATQDEELRKRINIEKSATRVFNFIHTSTEELKHFARLTGNTSVHDLTIDDLCTTNSELSNNSSIEHIGGNSQN